MEILSDNIEYIKNYFSSFFSSNVTKDNIKAAVIRSTTITSKYVNLCEFSNEEYKEGLILRSLDGSYNINPHHCYGSILFHPKYQSYFVDANLYFQISNNIFSYHTLCGKEFNIKRSNGNIEKGTIAPNTPIIYWDDYECLAINVEFGDYKKTVLLNSINDNGLITLNKEYFDNNIIKIFIKNGHNMFQEEKKKYLNLMLSHLKKSGLKYKIIYL